MVCRKGKEVGGKDKGKRVAENSEKTGSKKNKRNRGVVQFFDDTASEAGDDDHDTDFSGFSDWDFENDMENDFESHPSKVSNEPGKASKAPVFPKEEELSGDELEKMVEERYKPGSSYVTYADDRVNTRMPAVDENEGLSSYKEPIIWKVKCMIGREKQSVFVLMQKAVEFKCLGTKLHIISAFSIDHVKGFIYIEAHRQSDIYEACKGVTTIYSSRLAPVPKNEVISAFSVRIKCNEVELGSWARVKNGKYRGDLAQVIAVNDSKKKATVKLIPRIDLQALAEKYGGGVCSKKSAVPPARFVTSTELEEFRPLIQYRRDRESGLAFEVLDGMLLKDGYLYKKVSIDSLSLYGVVPSEDEVLKFESSKNEKPDCQEWLTELYGEKKKEPRAVKSDKGSGGKGDGSSSSSLETSLGVDDLVLFNRKDFGVIVGSEKDDYYKILKEGSGGPIVVTIEVRQLKKASFENRFTALDKGKKIISINDTVRVSEGPLEGRQGNVKHIYRGTIFFHDEVEQENNGYFCCKSQICEKVKLSNDVSKGKGGESSFPSFDDPPSSPKSPLAPEKPWETRGRNSSFNREETEGFTVGQSLRIRVGPLKGYLCRVLAIRRTNVTVKLDSQHKILTVKSEHLAEVRGRNSAAPISDDKDAKPFDLLGNPDSSADWMTGTGTGTSADGESSWPAFPSSGTSAQPNSAMEIDKNDERGGDWGSKVIPKPSSTWGNAAADEIPAVSNEQAGGWGNGGGSWGKPKTSTEGEADFSQGVSNEQASGWGNGGGSWSKPKTSTESQINSSQGVGGWGSGESSRGNQPKPSSDNQVGSSIVEQTQTTAWGKPATSDRGQEGTWGKIKNKKDDTSAGWGKTSNAGGCQGGSWGKGNNEDNSDAPAWGKTVESPNAGQGGSWGKGNTEDGGAPAWGKRGESANAGQGRSWGKSNTEDPNADQGGASAWGRKVEAPNADQGGSWGKSNSKDDGGAPAWDKKVEVPNVGQGGSWGKINMKKDDSGPSWGKTIESPKEKKDDSAPAWVKTAELPNAGQGGSWGTNNKKKDDGAPTWGKISESPSSGEAGTWGNKNTNKNDCAPAWGKIAESPNTVEGESWGKSNTNKDDSAPAWGNTLESSNGTPDKGTGEDLWGKASNSWGNKDDSRGKKVVWNNPAKTQESQGGGWGSGGGSSWGNKQNNSQEQSWDKTNSSDGERGSGERNGGRGHEGGAGGWGSGGSSWGKQGGGGSSWSQQNGGNDEGYGGGNRDGEDGGRSGGFGGRRGRGGWRGGNRGGRSFGEDDQGGRGRWSDLGGGDRGGFRGRGRSEWGGGRGGRSFGEDDQGGRGGFRGRGRSDWGGGGGFGGRGRRDGNSDWGNKQNDGDGEGGKSWGSNGGGSGGGSWNKPDGNQSSGWGAPKETNGVSGGSGWNNKGSGSAGNETKTGLADGDQPSILGTHPGSGFRNNSGGGSWNKPDGGQSSGWGTPKGDSEGGGSGGQ